MDWSKRKEGEKICSSGFSGLFLISVTHSSATEPKSHRATEPQSHRARAAAAKLRLFSSAVNTQPSAVDVKGRPLRRRACADFLDLMSDLYPSIAQCAVAAAALKFLLFPA